MADQKLMDYFKFDDADLQANRNGQFTEKQTARIVKGDKSGRGLSNLGGIILILIALIGVAVAVGVVVMTLLQSSSDWVFTIPFVAGFGCIWPLAWGGFGVRSFMYSSSSKRTFKLAKTQGTANIESRQTYTSDNRPDIIIYTLHIGGKNFKVDSTLSSAMMQGADYAVYYYIIDDLSALISTKNILSVELISSAR